MKTFADVRTRRLEYWKKLCEIEDKLLSPTRLGIKPTEEKELTVKRDVLWRKIEAMDEMIVAFIQEFRQRFPAIK